ncbi:acylneuraminate cytidylyltransferase family protein [Denitromonas iodatirespirans]|uniref:Acylneuraminate cytidylyltransferase family protein n=1 Tax=Denitromonas iodatirespirans TaxID=2795389 RepID=A0A944DB13_DENI1|nr:acylneuraminate cytidylyltransferase family protein [Denitromonas iodatirespirans]MBT0963465.1 acylneuraminate cytidylyltransferase family protein [Denitromonas iodatirespirans]
MKTICIIPARGGSKGLPRKNIKHLAGRPLIDWPIKAALASGVVDRVFVSTDDAQIAECARAAGADVPFLRPAELAQDLTTTEATLQQALMAYEAHVGNTFELCVFLTATDVFRTPDWITQAVQALIDDPALDSAFAVHQTTKNYWHKTAAGDWARVLPWMRDYSSRQIREKLYREDTGLACASRARLWREGRRIGDRVHLMPNNLPETSIDIHTDFDLFLAEKAIEYLAEHHPERVPLFTDDRS